MRPTFSIIFFTVVSGCGFGLLFVVGALLGLQPTSISSGTTLTALITGMAFAAAGLCASTLHLGQPQRAWRALSQWRSSWLSREGVASLATFAPALLLTWFVWRGDVSRVVALLLAVLSIVTLVCTSGIYTSLKTIRAWHNGWVLPAYLILGVLSACCVLSLIANAFGNESAVRLSAVGVVGLAIVAAAIKWGYWNFVDTYAGASTPESATGLGRIGTVRAFEAPHTEENYLTREMGFVLARKHASRLRGISLSLFAILPIIAAALTIWIGSGIVAIAVSMIASLSVLVGLFVERWLFFAQAKHVVTLFYATNRNA